MTKSIILLDDAQQSLAELGEALHAAGYAPSVLPPDADAVAAFDKKPPDLLFLSLLAETAVDACEAIRERPEGAIVPIIFIGTGKEAIASPSSALASGGDFYFELPLALDRVLGKVKTYIGGGAPTGAGSANRSSKKATPMMVDDDPTLSDVDLSPPSFDDGPTFGDFDSDLSVTDGANFSDAAGASDDPAAPTGGAMQTADQLMAELPDFSAPKDLGSSPPASDSEDLWSGDVTSPDLPALSASRAIAQAAANDSVKEDPAGIAALPDFDFGAPSLESETTLADASDNLLNDIKAEESAKAKERAEEEARRKAEEEARLKAEEEARLEAEEEARLKAEEEARLKAERDAQRKAEAEARLRAEEEARLRAETEARLRAEEEARLKAEEEARLRAQEEARLRAETEARLRAEEEARLKTEEERLKAEEARLRAEEEARLRAEEEARLRAEEEARLRAEEEARLRAEEEARLKAEEETRLKAEEETRLKAEEETRLKAEEETRLKAEEEARLVAEEEERQRVKEEIRKQLEAEFEQKRADEEARLKAEEEARIQAEEEARLQAEEEARLKAEEEARLKAEEEARLKAEEEARLKAEEEARLKAEQEARAKAEQEAEMRRRIEAEVRAQMGLPPPQPVGGPPSADADAENADEEGGDPTEATPQNRPRPASASLTPLETPAGEFSIDKDIAALLGRCSSEQITGRLEIKSGKHQKVVFFELGEPVGVYSELSFDRMEEYLLRQGLITRTHYNQVRMKELNSPRKIGAYLVSESFLKPHELFSAVRGHLLDCLYGLFEWETGSFQYTAETVREDDRITLDQQAPAIIMDGVRRKYLHQRLLKSVGAPSSLLTPVPDVDVDLDRMALRADERQVVRLLDGTRSVEDLVFSTGLDGREVYAVLATMLSLGYVQVAVRGIEGLEADGSSAADTIDSDRIQEKLKHVRELDYFQVLGVARTATPYETDRAFDRNLREFAAKRFSEQIQRDFHDDLLEIERVLADAREVLRDEGLRDAYARNLP